MTPMLLRFPDAGPFEHRIQLAELDYVTTWRAAAQTLVEYDVGLLYTINVAWIHRIDRTRNLGSIDPDPVSVLLSLGSAGRPDSGAGDRVGSSLGGKARGDRGPEVGLAL